MKISLRLTLPLVLFTLSSAPARADLLALSAVGGLNFSDLSVSSLPTGESTSMGTNFGFGVLGAYGFFPGFAAELGVLDMPRSVNLNDSAGKSISSVTGSYLEIPLLVRFTALPIISFGAGAYYAHTLGNPSVSVLGGSSVSANYPSNYSQSDFGLEGSVAASYSIMPMISVFADLRGLLGLVNEDSSGATTQHYRNVEILAGVTLSI